MLPHRAGEIPPLSHQPYAAAVVSETQALGIKLRRDEKRLRINFIRSFLKKRIHALQTAPAHVRDDFE